MSINRDLSIYNWIQTNMSLSGQTLFNWINSDKESHAIKSVPNDSPKKDVLGNKEYKYDFMLQVVKPLSTKKDTTNTTAIDYVREWQEWIETQEEWHNYPLEFATEYKNLKLENVTGTPFISTNETTAEYHFFARLYYTEVVK